jgi:hypothetical protein
MEYLLRKQEKLLNQFPVAYGARLRKIASLYCAAGQINIGRSYYAQSVSKNPFDIKAYSYWLISYLGKGYFKRAYSIRKELNK